MTRRRAAVDVQQTARGTRAPTKCSGSRPGCRCSTCKMPRGPNWMPVPCPRSRPREPMPCPKCGMKRVPSTQQVPCGWHQRSGSGDALALLAAKPRAWPAPTSHRAAGRRRPGGHIEDLVAL